MWLNTHNIKLAILTILRGQFSGSKHIHGVVQPSHRHPRNAVIVPNGTLSPVNTAPPPAPGAHRSAFCSINATVLWTSRKGSLCDWLMPPSAVSSRSAYVVACVRTSCLCTVSNLPLLGQTASCLSAHRRRTFGPPLPVCRE